MHKKIEERRIRELENREKGMIEEYGWVVRYVFETEKKEFGGLANIYTVGLPQSYGHQDLQIVLPIPQHVAHGVLSEMVMAIQNGQTFESDTVSDKVLRGFDVELKEYHDEEVGASHLRVLLPDPQGFLPSHPDCDPMYAKQLDNFPFYGFGDIH